MTTFDDRVDPATLTDAELRQYIAGELTRARDRTTALTEAVDEEQLISQHSPLMSPLVWDHAHIGNQEEIWLVRDVGGRRGVREDIDQMYDAFQNARADRPSLPLLSPGQARGYVRQVRDEVLDVLSSAPLDSRRLTRDGFVFGMVVQHEQQHDETMLATHQLRRSGAPLPAPGAGRAAGGRTAGARYWCPAGRSIRAPRPRPGRWTTNGRPTGSTCRRSGSTPCR